MKDIEDKRKNVMKEDRGVSEVSLTDLDLSPKLLASGSFKDETET